MSGKMPNHIKIYHILHTSRLSGIISEGFLLSDAEMQSRPSAGETIGMRDIKRRRLEELTLSSHPGLHVGKCVPFYFCPRSVMLYMFHMRNHPDIEYRGGQEPIIHLEVDMLQAVKWALMNGCRWAFTNSNAGSNYFEDFSSLKDLDKLDWDAIQATSWRGRQDKKQAEFLIEEKLPWALVESIGVYSPEWMDAVNGIIARSAHRPLVKIKKDWYY